jgi:hypothetical protein
MWGSEGNTVPEDGEGREILPLFMYEENVRSGKEKQQRENARESKI